MLAIREHFLDKYFGYRRRYVDAVAALAPNRRPLAVASEIARLAFSIFGNVLCAAILWFLFAGAVGRTGGIGTWPVVFGILALLPTIFGLLAMRSFGLALADRKTVA
jgi:F0F1-type ATP synthase membrane subunit a